MQFLERKIDRLLADPQFDYAIHRLAAGFVDVQAAAPRLASQFATQQRWLMSHAALSCYFRGLRSGRPGLSRNEFLEASLGHRLASRNTATAFFAEALHYGLVRPIGATGRNSGLVEPSPSTLWALAEWYALHLSALDTLDGANRVERLRSADLLLLAEMESGVADGLLGCELIRDPAPIYAVFASVDDGGSLMDRLIVGLDRDAARAQEQALTDVTSISALARRLNLSRTHTGRTVAAAVALGGLGWSGAPGRSPIWLSRRFREEYAQIQATKLAIIGSAFDAAARVAEPAMPQSVSAAPDMVRGHSDGPAC
jgi:hypothetical protein